MPARRLQDRRVLTRRTSNERRPCVDRPLKLTVPASYIAAPPDRAQSGICAPFHDAEAGRHSRRRTAPCARRCDPRAGTGYVPESYLIEETRKVGFVLEAKSEINANPKDTDKPHRIWIEQCEAARTIRERFGLEAAFDYAVGEKLMNFASAAHDHQAFARELPRFVSEVRRMFSVDEIRTQLARLEREQIERDAKNGDPDEDEVLCETPAMAAKRIRQFATIKDLLCQSASKSDPRSASKIGSDSNLMKASIFCAGEREKLDLVARHRLPSGRSEAQCVLKSAE